MKESIEKRDHVLDQKVLIFFLVSLFLFNIILLRKYGEQSLIAFSVEIVFLLSAIIFFSYKKDYVIYIILVFLLQFVFLNNDFHYSFSLEFLLSFPLFILLLLAWFRLLYVGKSFSIVLSKFQKVILLFVLYSFVMAFIGLLNARDTLNIFVEWFHMFYYSFFFVFMFFLKKREDYYTILSFLLVLSLIISVEYIVVNFYLFNYRFVTFQSNFLPIVVGVLISSFFFKYKRVTSLILLMIVIIGMISTQTRSLWIVTIIVLLSTLFLYMKTVGKFSFKKLILLLLVCMLPFFLISDKDANKIADSETSNQIENRAESISDPVSDISFLMRVEATYYAINKFLESPIWGKGFGDHLRLVITRNDDFNLYYIDNSWGYMLWKGGLIGITLFFLMVFYSVKYMYYVSQNTTDLKTKIIIIGLLGGFIGMIVLGTVSPHFIKYKSNVFFPLIFAYVDYEYKRLKANGDN